MKTMVLIACASKKITHKARAEDLYISPLFVGNLRYAKSLAPDAIFILSAMYGLLDLDKEIEPYNVTLKDMSTAQVRAWANGVLEQLARRADLQHDHFVFLAGDVYRKFLVPHLASYEVPLAGMRIGEQLQFLAAHP